MYMLLLMLLNGLLALDLTTDIGSHVNSFKLIIFHQWHGRRNVDYVFTFSGWALSLTHNKVTSHIITLSTHNILLIH